MLRSQLIARLCAAAALLICLVGCAGHAFDIQQMVAVRAGWQVMSLLTAVGLGVIALCGVVPHLPSSTRTILGLTAFTVATMVLASHALFDEDRVNPPLFRWLFGDGVPVQQQGRTSTATAISMLVLALASLPGRLSIYKDRFASVAFVIAALALLGYGYGAKDLYSVPMFNTMALNTATAIVLMAASAVMSAPDRGWANTIWLEGEVGRVTRRQIALLVVPIALGWALVRWAALGSLGLGAAMALLVLMTVVSTFILILRDGRGMENLAVERRRIEQMTQRHTQDLETQLTAQADALQKSNAARLQLAEEAQAHSEGRYRTLFDSIEPGFCVIEMKFDAQDRAIDYRFLETNAAFTKQTGIATPAGKWMRELYPDHEQHWFDRYGEVARTGVEQRFELPAAELGQRWYDVHAFSVDDASLQRVGILFSDVTVRRQAESSLRELNSTLELRVRTAIAEREQAHAALRQSQKMEAIGQLTGGVAHDFNNLLSPIMTTIDVFIRKGGSSERELRLLQGAMRSAERAKLLIQRLLAFARRQPLQIGPVDLTALVDGLSELISSTLGAKIQLDMQMAADLVPVLGDANQIEMAILNLCVNARDAMPSGGRLVISAHLERLGEDNGVEVPAGHYARLSVIDTGAGMDEETLKRAIEPFFSTKGVGQGTGLGLSMAHGLASQLGGGLTITSAPGKGTRVDLWLKPGVEVMQAPVIQTDAPPSARFQGRALVVDDEEWVRASTCDMLQEIGYQTFDVDSAEKAEALLRRDSAFDLVVTDQMMPGMTGSELVQVLRESWPKLPVLIVSGFAEVKDVAHDIKFLSKPFRLKELSEMITEVVR